MLTLGRLANYNQFHACSNLFIISCDKSTCGPPARCSWQHPSPSAPLVASDSQKTHKSMRGCPENGGMNHPNKICDTCTVYIYIYYLLICLINLFIVCLFSYLLFIYLFIYIYIYIYVFQHDHIIGISPRTNKGFLRKNGVLGGAPRPSDAYCFITQFEYVVHVVRYIINPNC